MKQPNTCQRDTDREGDRDEESKPSRHGLDELREKVHDSNIVNG